MIKILLILLICLGFKVSRVCIFYLRSLVYFHTTVWGTSIEGALLMYLLFKFLFTSFIIWHYTLCLIIEYHLITKCVGPLIEKYLIHDRHDSCVRITSCTQNFPLMLSVYLKTVTVAWAKAKNQTGNQSWKKWIIFYTAC